MLEVTSQGRWKQLPLDKIQRPEFICFLFVLFHCDFLNSCFVVAVFHLLQFTMCLFWRRFLQRKRNKCLLPVLISFPQKWGEATQKLTILRQLLPFKRKIVPVPLLSAVTQLYLFTKSFKNQFLCNKCQFDLLLFLRLKLKVSLKINPKKILKSA